MKRAISISLLIVFLAGQVNLTWASHYCGSFKVKSSMMLGHSHLDCGMEETMECERETTQSGGMAVEKNNCCKTQYFSSDADNFFAGGKTSKPITVDFIIAFTSTCFDFAPNSLVQEYFLIHSPPLIQEKKCILYQSLLI